MKNFEKYILVLVCLLCANAWAAWNNDQTTPSQDEDGVYLISTPAELAGFASIVNSGGYSANARLTADLIFGDDEKTNMCTSENVSSCWKSWNPIGPNASKAFTGILDGDGHTIYGLFVSSSEMALGLVGVLGEDGVVKNLNVVNPLYVSTRNWSDVNYFSLGGVVGTNYGTVLNCHVIDASVDVSNANVAYHSATGGVVGINGDANHQNAKVLNCSSSGNITGRYVGGIVGWNNYGLVSGSYSTASIIGKTEGKDNGDPTLDSTYAGGIIGYNATNATLDLSVYYGGDISLTDAGWSGSLIGNGGDGSAVRESYYEDTDGPGAGECGSGSSGCSFDGVDIDTLTEPQKEALVDALNKNAKENCKANGGSDCDVPAWNLKDGEIISTGAENAQNAADGFVTLRVDNDATKASVAISGKKDGYSVTGGTAFDKNTEISITLTLLNGAEFQKWTNSSGDSISNANPYTFTISSSTYLKTNFTEDPQTETIIAQYGENATDTIEVVVPVSADSAARVAAVNDAFENHNPAIESPQKTDGSDDSTYTFAGFVPDEDGVYQPTFTAELKTETIVAQYGENATDTIEVVVPETADSAARVAAVNDAFENHDPAIESPQKTDGSDDSTYTFAGFVPDEDGVYKPTFTAELKTETIVAQYGENATDTIEVVVPETADSAARVAAVNDAFENHDPAIESPQKTDGSDDSTYTFAGFVPDEDGVYKPTFTAELKTETVVVKYGDGVDDQIEVAVPQSADNDARVAIVEDTLENHSPKITPSKTETSEYKYVFDHWSIDGNTFTAEFTAVPKNDTLVVQYGENSTDTILVVVPVETDSVNRVAAVNDAFENHNPAIESPQKTDGSDDSTYTFAGFVPDEDGVYKPTFTAELKTETVVVKYGENATDTIEVVVPVSADSAARVAAVNDAFENHSPAIPDPQKTDGSADSTYTFTGFEPDENGVYQPTFEAEVKTETIVAQYGENATDTIEVVVPVSADSAARVDAVNEAFENHSPAIPDPQKTDGSADSTYTFTGFEPDENGVYQPTFEAEVKTETVVIAYGDSDDERIDVIFLVTYNNKERLATIDSALAAQNPPVVVKKTNGSDDSTYTHIGWQTKIDMDSNVVVDENGNPIYEPMFEATVKTTELVVVYGADPEKDVVRIPVPVTLRDSAARVQLVIDSLAAWKITPTKTDEDSTYTFDKWNVDGDTYTAEFISSPKYIEVVVGDDTVKVKVPVDDDGGQGGSQGDDVAVEIKVVVDEDTLTVSVSDGDVLDSVIKEVVKDDPTKTGEDSTYEFSGWEPITDDTGKPVVDENGNPIYGPVFDAEVKKETMVIAYGDGVDERINVVVPVTYGDNERIDAIDSALKAHTPPIEVKKTNGSDDSTYTHIGWQMKIDKDSNVVVDENDNAVYEPMFKASVKTTEVVVVYGADPEKDVVRIQIPVTLKDSESRIEAVSDSLAARDISPAKADEDSTYTFDKWNVDGNTFTAEFKSTVKTIELVVVYGSDPAKDSIHVVVHVPDNDSIRLEKVKAAIETAGIIPMKAEDADSIYSFNGNWAKTEDGFRAEFDGKAKFIKVVVGEDSVKVSIPEDQISGLDEGEDVVVEVKVVVDGDTIKVPVSEGDNLDSAANKVLDSIPTKDDTADSTYEFAGWEPITDSSGKSVVDENGNEIYEPVFDADVKKETIVVSTGDDKGSTIEVLVKVTDSDAEIQDAIKKSFEENDIPLPSKSRENEKVYTFEKFVYNKKSGIFEPKFDERVLYDITFVLPENGKLLSEFEGYVYGERTKLPEACIMDDDEWEFKGWYTEPNGLGTRVKYMLETDVGKKVFFPLFQKTVTYSINGTKGDIEVIYSKNAEKNILRSLDRVIPEDFRKKNVNFTFDKWELENGIYVAQFVEGQGIRSNVQVNFRVNVAGHALEITGANSGSKVYVFDARGRLVQRAITSVGTLHLNVKNSGRYIVRVDEITVPVDIR